MPRLTCGHKEAFHIGVSNRQRLLILELLFQDWGHTTVETQHIAFAFVCVVSPPWFQP
jgi:hypothetical protein